MKKVLGLACLMLIACCAEAAARCSGPGIYPIDNQTVITRVSMKSGSTCRIRFVWSSGPMHGAKIVQRPSHGTVQVGEFQSINYVSRRGFVGSDAFTYARHGFTRGGTPTTRTVQVLVTVRP